jgi:hypothetical protein
MSVCYAVYAYIFARLIVCLFLVHTCPFHSYPPPITRQSTSDGTDMERTGARPCGRTELDGPLVLVVCSVRAAGAHENAGQNMHEARCRRRLPVSRSVPLKGTGCAQHAAPSNGRVTSPKKWCGHEGMRAHYSTGKQNQRQHSHGFG